MTEEISYNTEEEFNAAVLKRVQDIGYGMLSVFDGLCRQNGADYSLFLGSALGALRHEAIIPWDNDVDTIMWRTEYDKIRPHMNELPEDYFWLKNDILGDKKCFDCVDRIAYKKAYFHVNPVMEDFYENNFNSVHLDIFLMDKTYDNFKGKLQRYELVFLYGMMNAYRCKELFFDYNRNMRIANAICRFFGRMFPLRWLKKRADKVARRFDDDPNAPLGFISNDVLRALMTPMPIEWFMGNRDVKFGAMTARIFSGADEYCRYQYGDYMQLPPEEARIPHAGRFVMPFRSYVFEEPVRGRAE